jgi:hypothetical protein
MAHYEVRPRYGDETYEERSYACILGDNPGPTSFRDCESETRILFELPRPRALIAYAPQVLVGLSEGASAPQPSPAPSPSPSFGTLVLDASLRPRADSVPDVSSATSLVAPQLYYPPEPRSTTKGVNWPALVFGFFGALFAMITLEQNLVDTHVLKARMQREVSTHVSSLADRTRLHRDGR